MIQIDMPMPKNCLDCPACNEYLMCAIPVNGRRWGENDVREFGQSRPEWCPMKDREAQKFLVDSDGKITPLPVVVRCKDCAYYADSANCPVFGMDRYGDWFCADGERRDVID